MANKNPQKIPKYFCSVCQYITNNKKDFLKHMATPKHLKMAEMLTNANKKSPEHIDDETSDNVTENAHKCEFCSRIYKHLPSLSRHKNNCKLNKPTLDTPSNIVVELIKQSKDLQNLLIEQNKQIIELSKNQNITNNITTNNTNTTNQQFNIQFFLNETCKDAMTLTDFVNSLQLQIEDFEATGKLGYVEGISRIIINGLKRVDTTKRPIHCTDIKRETLYIKNDNTWEKEEPEKTKLKHAVNQVARMNLSQLPKWQKENPESEILDTKENDDYIKYSMAALGGRGVEEEEKFVNKIMKNVIKEVLIDKSK
jgi:hypothetical protein